MADYIISQTEDQRAMLLKNHGLDSQVIFNPIELENYHDEVSEDDKYILWIGRSEPYNKRPELLLEIARRLPLFKFRMILNNIDPGYFNKIVRSKSDNIEIIEYVLLIK
jgi:glycosyltransferase involved in cell wall biosynthesis